MAKSHRDWQMKNVVWGTRSDFLKMSAQQTFANYADCGLTYRLVFLFTLYMFWREWFDKHFLLKMCTFTQPKIESKAFFAPWKFYDWFYPFITSMSFRVRKSQSNYTLHIPTSSWHLVKPWPHYIVKNFNWLTCQRLLNETQSKIRDSWTSSWLYFLSRNSYTSYSCTVVLHASCLSMCRTKKNITSRMNIAKYFEDTVV